MPVIQMFTASPPDRQAELKARIMELICAGRRLRDGRVQDRPGTHSVCELRVRIGGRTSGELFRSAIEELLAKGKILEVWQHRRGRQQHAHTLLMPGFSHELRYQVVQARGLDTLILREPWGPALLARTPPAPKPSLKSTERPAEAETDRAAARERLLRAAPVPCPGAKPLKRRAKGGAAKGRQKGGALAPKTEEG